MHKKRTWPLLVLLILFLIFDAIGITVFCITELKRADSLNSYTADTIHYFYAEEPDSLDGIYLGSSAANRYWSPAEAFAEEGICIYNLGTYIQPFVATRYLIEEALKSQTEMDVIVVEVRNLVRPPDKYDSDDFKRVSDMMPYSSNRSDMIEAYLEYCKEIEAEIDYESDDYYVPAVRDDGEWAEDYDLSLLEDLYDDTSIEQDKGFNASFDVKPLNEPPEYTDREPLTKTQEELLRELLSYCRGIEPEVVFVSAPFASLGGREGMLRTALDICEEEGFTTLDFNCEPLRSQLGTDWSRDFYNSKHMNWYGAKKYTDFVAAYLAETYDLADHRQEAGYDSWHKAVDTLEE